MAIDIDKRTGQYVQVRDAIKRLKKQQEEELAPLLQLQDQLGGIIRQHMETNNIEGLKTASGTCYLSTRYSASLADADAFMNYVVQNGMFELIDRKANAAAVHDFVKEKGCLPPGCNLSAIQTLGVRRPTGGSHQSLKTEKENGSGTTNP